MTFSMNVSEQTQVYNYTPYSSTIHNLWLFACQFIAHGSLVTKPLHLKKYSTTKSSVKIEKN